MDGQRRNRFGSSSAILVSADVGLNRNHCSEARESTSASNRPQLIFGGTSGDLRNFALTSDTSYIHVTDSKLKYLGIDSPDQKVSGQKTSKWCSGIAGLILGCFGANSRAARVLVDI
uniref:Uncharacterized protein n=1 Tax=Cryptomonas curvata TaxID=233186 RepID=A0A6T7WL69_9CRYP|mmetsp:Transcript_2135/g.4411  ORF Transcript_2135/g.4411 Transcript_2135/m.4411 type:complete len:117 (+) Transcript_2135:55-405(+)|eukprot:CAMPEP_0172201646 /NCGR_PEP_ID=MMETSP1050-20130122/30146_1 /TAXON_ID=233186 /ORGANISM="Cryptomonas curvata, Strain CCAP979/52" /LENGTH=116 /DNA_ID=CAMNT_0012879377 /DNA_START=46 /DNA_END=396 /DNA_ORIENTATION=+